MQRSSPGYSWVYPPRAAWTIDGAFQNGERIIHPLLHLVVSGTKEIRLLKQKTMKHTLILPALLLTGTMLIRAQEIKSNALGVNLGMGNLLKQDLIFSPFMADDWSPVNVRVQYAHYGKLRHDADLRFGQYSYYVGEPFNYFAREIEYEKLPHSFVNVDLNYSLSKILKHTTNWTISAGGRIRNRYQISNFDFGHAGQFSYHLSMGLDALVKMEYRTGDHALNTSLALPVFSYLARSPYTGQDDLYLERIMVHGDLKIFAQHLKTGTIQSWNTSRALDFELGYDYSLNEKWDLGICYLFSLNLHNSPLKYTSIENIFYIGTTLKF